MSLISPDNPIAERMALFEEAGSYCAPLVVTTCIPGLPGVEYCEPAAGDPNGQAYANIRVTQLLFAPEEEGMEVQMWPVASDIPLALSSEEIDSVSIDHPDSSLLPLHGKEIPPLAVLCGNVGVSPYAKRQGLRHIVAAETVNKHTRRYVLRGFLGSVVQRVSPVDILMTGIDGQFMMTANFPGDDLMVTEFEVESDGMIVEVANYAGSTEDELSVAHERRLSSYEPRVLRPFLADVALIGLTKRTLASNL